MITGIYSAQNLSGTPMEIMEVHTAPILPGILTLLILPVILDQDGNFFGFLTLNPYKSDRSQLELAMILYKHHEDIKKDVGSWYEKLFR